jgi:hypothetical protein
MEINRMPFRDRRVPDLILALPRRSGYSGLVCCHCKGKTMLELIGVLGLLVSIIAKLIFVQIGAAGNDKED